ncbi:NeuD/PglB/VioB family sugar acetyltransferase [Telluria beijingensis]|uniref:NeuD/PglB/VioB family sugar acetyltransferase n=1 Tax=Telluria beijingensis TaxID=3068633 RepID=UPI0027960FF9|nr:NeuD/PglB/VioB family sugar acetyltransferase [Massilia sp. REN29]
MPLNEHTDQQRTILVGAGAFARELIEWSLDGALEDGRAFTAFLDSSPAALDGFGYRLDYLGAIDDFIPREGDRLVMAIGDPAAKARLGGLLKARGARFARLVHPSATVARSALLGEGVVICPQAVVSSHARVGDLVAINALSGVGHDVVLGACSTLSCHVDLTGRVEVGEGCFFGSGARVLPKVAIGAGARIGAGATVMRNVPANAVMYAMPAKKL